MLDIANLTISYGARPAVLDVDLSVGAGEVVALLGPNGAGKTSIVNSIFGIAPKSRGRVLLEGSDISALPPEDIVRRGLAVVPEGRHIFPALTVDENLRLGGLAGPVAKRYTMDDLFAVFPVLKQYRRTHAGRLSGGEQQQLAIARALLSSPRLLVLDEPSLGLAPQVIDLVFDVLAQLRSDGLTVLLVEQNARRALAFADRSYIMVAGAVVLSGTADELNESDAVLSAYLGSSEG